MADLTTDINANDLETKTILVYMDGTDFVEGLGLNWNGVPVYPSDTSVVYNSKCVKSCGIVELKVQFSRVVTPGSNAYFLNLDVGDVQNKTQAYWDWQRSLLSNWQAHRTMLQDRIKTLDKMIRQKEDELKAV
jgi:hypothetical protein